MRVADFDFHLPEALIAQQPTAQRTASRLLHLHGPHTALTDRQFAVLPSLMRAGDVLVLNDTRVIAARLHGHKASGGRIEMMIERVTGTHEAWALIRASHAPLPGSRLFVGDGADAGVSVLQRDADLFHLRFDAPLDAVLRAHGRLPLPPYITHTPTAGDLERYQTVYAAHPGAVAAPTAGLHFDQALLSQLEHMGAHIVYITLHVGAGTFQPVRVTQIADHRMHSERYVISAEAAQRLNQARAAGARVMAVGTTALRTLESAIDRNGQLVAGAGETALFITPGYRFQVVDRLLTNFHLPRSTLLMLVSAFGGMQSIRTAYAHAINAQYRFFSYGDAMLIERNDA